MIYKKKYISTVIFIGAKMNEKITLTLLLVIIYLK